MKSIKVSELKPGMKFSQPVYVDGNNILVPENLPLKEKDIKRLLKWHIDTVSTNGELIRDDGAGGSFLQKALSSPDQQEILRVYNSLTKKLNNIFTLIGKSEDVDVEMIDSIIDTLFKLIKNKKNETIQFILFGAKGESGYAENALDTAILSIVVGININIVQHKLIQLATGALLHDVGMLRMPSEITQKSGKLSSNEIHTMRTHPIITYRIITKELRYPEVIGLAGFQHHERWDGEGYPRGLSGKAITLFARIISVVDAYEAMISKRPYRNPMIGYSAMRAILGDNGRRFDPDILKLFIKSMGIYPIGSIVLLNNSAIGRVIDVHSESPLRPKVKVMINQSGTEYSRDEGEVIDLINEKKLFIAKAVDPLELAKKGQE